MEKINQHYMIVVTQLSIKIGWWLSNSTLKFRMIKQSFTFKLSLDLSPPLLNERSGSPNHAPHSSLNQHWVVFDFLYFRSNFRLQIVDACGRTDGWMVTWKLALKPFKHLSITSGVDISFHNKNTFLWCQLNHYFAFNVWMIHNSTKNENELTKKRVVCKI